MEFTGATSSDDRLLEIADTILLLVHNTRPERLSLPCGPEAGQFQRRLLSRYSEDELRQSVRFLIRLGVLVENPSPSTR